MKGILIAILLVMVTAIAAIITKPSDDQCRREVAIHEAGTIGGAAAAFGLTDVVIEVEDKTFYKSIRNRVTGREVAIGLFGNVIFE